MKAIVKLTIKTLKQKFTKKDWVKFQTFLDEGGGKDLYDAVSAYTCKVAPEEFVVHDKNGMIVED